MIVNSIPIIRRSTQTGKDSGILDATEDPSAETEGKMNAARQKKTVINTVNLRYLSLNIRSPDNPKTDATDQNVIPKNFRALRVVISQICSGVVPRISAMASAV